MCKGEESQIPPPNTVTPSPDLSRCASRSLLVGNAGFWDFGLAAFAMMGFSLPPELLPPPFKTIHTYIYYGKNYFFQNSH
jgi:hypothetical protein